MIDRVKEIKRKGFAMIPANDVNDALPIGPLTDFSKIRVGIKTLEDATIDVGSYKKVNPKYGDKDFVLKAINSGNIEAMREISNFFYKTSGIYNRVCRYFAYLYRYDWLVTPYINGGIGVVPDVDISLTNANRDKILTNFFKALKYLDDFQVKRFFGEVALKVVRFGCYYGYLVQEGTDKVSVQELPPAYCRSRFYVGNKPAVEFNMRFFDDYYPDTEQRAKVLNLFPAEFKKGYKAYKDGKLVPDGRGDTTGWYLLDIKNVIKFNLNGEDYPMFISAIPDLIDLDEAKDLDRKKVAQKLLKVFIQKMPLDKNGDLVFDVDEAQELHNNAIRMLGRAIGIDVLTTFADVDVADMSDKGNTSQTDDLERVERTVYNSFGTSQMNFNSNSNVALNNSIRNDESALYNLIQQFESFLNVLLEPYNKNPKKCYYKAQILSTTIYNYQDMARLYKEQVQMGYSKMLPQIALGQSQSSVLANAYWENDILDLAFVFMPPLTSNVLNAEALEELRSARDSGKVSTPTLGTEPASDASSSGEGPGRPEKDDSQKSDKTLANRESL